MKNLYLFLLIIFAPVSTYATHVMGSEIHYRSIGSGKYEITIKVYRDCNGVSMSQSNIIARCSATTITLSSQTKVSQRDVTGVGSNCSVSSRCSGSSYPYGIEEHVWKATLDLSSYSCCEWTLSWEQCCRNSNITTGQANENFFVTAQLNKCAGSNASPTFETLPIRMLCVNQNVTYNMGVQDTVDQGDSFSFSLVPAISGLNSSTTYNGQFSPSRPLTFLGFPNQNLAFPAGFHLNQSNGDLTFRPTTVNQIAVIVIEVSEWRKDSTLTWQVIGKTRRDMQVIVLNCAAMMSPPVLAGPFSYEFCAGDSINIPLITSDPDSADKTTLFKVSNTLPYTMFVHNSGTVKNASGKIFGMATANMISNQPYYITMMVKDNGCPLNTEITRTITVFIRHPSQAAAFYAGPDRNMGREDTLTLNGVDSFNIGQQAYWKSLGDGYFTDSLALNGFYHLGQGDRAHCEIQVLRIPLTRSTCGNRTPDTMTIQRWQGDISIELDSSSLSPDSAMLKGIFGQDSIYSATWSSWGDGTFSDDKALNTVYYFGSQDSLNCGAWIFYTSNSPAACSRVQDSTWVPLGIHFTRIYLSHTHSTNKGDTIFLSLNGGTNSAVNWYSTGTGTWLVDSVDHTAIYLPSQAEKTAGKTTFWATQSILCASYLNHADSHYVNLWATALDHPLELGLKLYPNPTDGNLQLESIGLSQIRSVKIFDIHGKEILLKAEVEANTYTWDVSSLSQGMYMLVITDQTGNKIPLRFIVR